MRRRWVARRDEARSLARERSLVRKRGLKPEGQARSATAECLRHSSAQRMRRSRNELVRKRGLEPPRYCYRQPLKLVRLPIPPLPRGGWKTDRVYGRRRRRTTKGKGNRDRLRAQSLT